MRQQKRSQKDSHKNFLAVWTETLSPGTMEITAWLSLVGRDQEISKANSRDLSWQRPRQSILVLQEAGLNSMPRRLRHPYWVQQNLRGTVGYWMEVCRHITA